MRDAPPADLRQRIRIETDGTVVALSGKIEFGQGIRTGFAQLVAEELDVPPERVRLLLGDTAQVPFDFGTFGSHSTEQEAPVLRRAAAYARQVLLSRASDRFGVPVATLRTEDGAVLNGGTRVSYADLVKEQPLAGAIPDDVPLRPRSEWRYLGKPRPRVEAREIVTGRATYTADVRLPGMLRGAMVRPPARGARVRSVDDARAKTMPGVVAVIRDSDLVGVVAERDEQARAAAEAVLVEWDIPAPEQQQTTVIPMLEDADIDAALAKGVTRLENTYVLPAIANAPIGPNAAVADVRDDGATLYGATHRPFTLRETAANKLGLPTERVRFVPQMSSGTYGRTSTLDVPLEAVALSKAVRRPVLVQWTRAEEFLFSPSRPEAVLEVAAALDKDGRIVAWRYDEHTNVHTSGGFDPSYAPQTSGRNAIPPYDIPRRRVTLHMEPTPLRTANFRSLAAAENVFAIESFVDELALASKQDPVAFRLRHTKDARLRTVLDRVAARSSWGQATGERRAKGIACTVYHGTYVAQVAEVEVTTAGAVRVLRVWCAVDPGLAVNPEGVRNQIEGGIQQSASWTIFEELRHKNGRVATTAWDQYPIATFRDAPLAIEVDVIESDAPSTGVGEPGAVPTAAAIANAVFAACGARIRELPLSRERVRNAMRT